MAKEANCPRCGEKVNWKVVIYDNNPNRVMCKQCDFISKLDKFDMWE